MTDYAPLFLGIDVGTSGVRTSVIGGDAVEITAHAIDLPSPVVSGSRITQDPQLWLRALAECLHETSRLTDFGRLAALAVDATSGTILLCDGDGSPLTAAMMYNDASSVTQAGRITGIAPERCGAHGAGSSLARLLALQEQVDEHRVRHACHQADFITGWLSGRYDVSDENNCLKLGYDVVDRRWPEWLQQLGVNREWLPEATRPGSVIGTITGGRAQQFGIGKSCRIVSGTTDSIAAFIATGADTEGDAVTSLGSTLVVKQLGRTPVFSPAHGVYSHRYYADDGLWLAGGASSAGCRVLSQLFSQQQLDAMTPRLKPDEPTGLSYYPLPIGSTGERFPVADPQMMPVLEPRPDDDVRYFQGLLESIADIERDSYRLLAELGAGRVERILTAGGGSRNPAWTRIRQGRLACPIESAAHSEACYGAALLARHGAKAV